MQSQTQQKNQQLCCSFDVPEGEHIRTDRLKLQDLLLNLISNAVKYTPADGRIEFSVRHVTGPDRRLTYEIRISDTGIGMSQDFLTRVFEPFAQEQDSRAEGITGTGLGLSIVKRIVDLMEGTITVQSEKNVGTVFTVLLPVEAKQLTPVPVGKKEELAVVSLQGMNVLLCEDNALNREIITELLAAKGIHVHACADGLKGVAAFAEAAPGTYEAILMDIQMPHLDGYGATDQIRHLDRPDARTIPIIALSANAYEEDIKKSLALGMTAHLAKPINSAQLIGTLEKYAGRG